MFLILAARPEENNNGTGWNKSLLSEIKVHLLCLKEELSRYFPDKQTLSFGQIFLHI
jgi:hypothetical protein